MDKFCRQEIFHTNHGELEVQEFSAETDYVHVKDERIEEVRQAAKEDKEQELLRQVIVDLSRMIWSASNFGPAGPKKAA